MTLTAGLFGPDGVDVAYEPWRALRRTELRVGPDTGSPVVLTDRGEPVYLDAGGHLGRQTTRNPACLDRPPLRPAVGGFVWGYCMAPAIRKSGWMRLGDLEADRAFEDLACGPAGHDFDRRRPDACGGHCDGRPLTGVRPAAGAAEVTARDLYLRFAPRSTAFRYLAGGDQVRLLARWGSWLGVEVRRARWTPRGSRGWVLASYVATERD
ncbi:MAG: hypothetical protein ACXVFT_07505 [Solirubrobacteraceae bacterium]